MKENQDVNTTQEKKFTLISKDNKKLVKKLKSNDKQKKIKLKPSELLIKKQNNLLPIHQKMEPKIIEFLNTKDFTCQVTSILPIETPLFEPLPPVIMFSDYEALNVKTAILKLRNRDQVARRVKIIQPETNLFRINPIHTSNTDDSIGNKIAPGLDLCYEIKFSPERKTDYKYDLIVVTEREKFIVPIIAIGKKPLIVFPDEINFGVSCPVKYFTEKPIIIHNQGEKTAKWEIRLPENFDSNKKEGILAEKCSEQIVMKFYPTQRKYYESFGQLIYDDDQAEFLLKGNAINGEVYLSKNYIQQEETYISLESRDTFKIVNKSNVKIDFEWRAFSSEQQENEKKSLLLQQINKEEQEKRQLIYDTLDLEDNLNNFSQDSNEYDDLDLDEINEKEQMLKKRKKAEMLLDRKYKAIRKAIEEDTLVFEDDIFDIQPVRGSIWPNSEMTITVIFKPQASLRYLHQAYCNISCSDQRLPLYLEGEGLGPKAFLSTNSLSISDIFVNDKQLFNIYIENKGEIPARFSLIKNNTSFSQMIRFDIEQAELAVGQRMNIIMTFQSSKVGEFQELFKWKLEGSNEVLQLLVRGHVQAPKFEFSKKLIDFKKVSYQFEKTEEIEISNTSTVPFSFELRIPQDGKGNQKEFEIIPNRDQILPNESKKILIKFVPHFRKAYKSVMVLDIEGIGKDMKSIPIIGESEVPQVKVFPDVLDFGDIFLRYKQTQEIELMNESNLYARFIVHRLNPKYDSLGMITTDLDKGQIAPKSSIKININLITTCIKNFEIDFIIEIVSDKNTQHLIKVKANSIGPIVELSRKEIDFGEVRVLTKHIEKITLTNKSVINADFFAFTKNKQSVFKPLQKRYVLKPGESFDVEVVCYADDQQKFQDTLYFVIKEGMDKEVQLKARGVGSTIFCKDISQVNFGTIYTHESKLQEVFLENKGRRVQQLRWQRKIEKGEEEQIQNVFTVFPESVSLPPKMGLVFQFKAFSLNVGQIQENYTLTSAIGTDRKTNTLFVTSFTGNFIKPLLECFPKSLDFKYIWNKFEEASIISQNLEILSKGPLPTSFSLHIEPPFEVFPKNFQLLPNKRGQVKIEFNPTLNPSKFSTQIKEKLFIKHNKHPKNETYEVSAEFCFPNLKIDCQEVDFGAVMNDTSKKKFIVMENNGIIDVEYEWYFIDDGKKYDIPINEVFDILPLRGKIEPGVQEKVEFSYYAIPQNSFYLTAVCKTIGGPEYYVKIKAEASDVGYTVTLPKDKNFLDVGDAFLNQRVVRDFKLENTSKVVFEYSVRLDTSGPRSNYMKEFIKINPNKGVINGKETQTIKVSITPGFPNEINEHIILQVAHFQPERILIKGQGIFPSLRINMPMKYSVNLKYYIEKRFKIPIQQQEEEWQSLFEQISDNQLISAEVFMIKNYIKENFVKINIAPIASMTKSFSKKISSKNSLVQMSSKNLASKSTISKVKREFNFIGDIPLGTYSIDMGTIIAGTKVSKTIKIKNIGKTPLSLDFDQAHAKIPGLHLSNTKIHKLNMNSSVEITITLKTKKNIKAGKTLYLLPIKLKEGGKYFLELDANINIPDLRLSSQIVDFQDILVGTQKIITIRLINEKIIPCTWYVSNGTQPMTKKKKKLIRFFIDQQQGHLDPNSQQNFQIKFEPLDQGKYEEKFIFTFKDSNRKLELFCKGNAVIPQLVFEDSKIKFAPCLPGETLFRPMKVINYSKFDLELILTQFDTDLNHQFSLIKHAQQNSIVKSLKQFNQPFWKSLERECIINKQNKEINEKIEQLQTLEQNEEIENEILNLKSQLMELPLEKQSYQPVLLKDQINLILISKDQEYLQKLAQFFKQEQNKQIISVDRILQWHLEQETYIGKQAQNIINEKQEELNVILNSKKKQKNPIDPVEFMYIDNNLLQQLIEYRLKQDDCKAGVTFINIHNNLQNIESTLTAIHSYYKEAQILIFDLQQKESEQSNDLIEQQQTAFYETLNLMKINEDLKEFIKQKLIKESKQHKQSYIFNLIDNFQNVQSEEEEQKQEEVFNDSIQIKEIYQKWFEMNNAQIKQEENVQEMQKYFENWKYNLVNHSDNLMAVNYQILQLIPEPIYQKPEQLPLPDPLIEQIIKRGVNSQNLLNINELQILTYKEKQLTLLSQEVKEQDQNSQDDIIQEENQLTSENYLNYLESGKTRWFLKAGDQIDLCFKFQSYEIQKLEQKILFEYQNVVWNNYHKGWVVDVEAQTLFPEFNRNIVNIFPIRRKTKFNKKGIPYKKFYNFKEKAFNFGPILIRQDTEENPLNLEILQNLYQTNFRITNNSPFKIQMHFEMEKPEPLEPIDNKKNKSKQVPIIEQDRFILSENYKEILPGETFDLMIEADPRKEENYSQNLLINVENNPVQETIKINYNSITPKININQSYLDFERLILNKQSSKEVLIKNISLTPVHWRIVNYEEIISHNFTLSIQEGQLNIDEQQEITINFTSLEEKIIEFDIQIEVYSQENNLIKSNEQYVIHVKAEGFKILVEFLGFENPQKMYLNFGQTQVQKRITKNFQLQNFGNYPIDIELFFFKKKIETFFEYQKEKFELTSQQMKIINLTFLAQEEVNIGKQTKAYLTVKVIEKDTQDLFKEVKIEIEAMSQYSKYIINPNKQLNFGPIIFNETRKRTFEFMNNGLFEFDWDLYDFTNQEQKQQILDKYQSILQSDEGDKKSKPKEVKKKKEDALKLDVFTIEPSSGKILPGQSVQIEVTFEGKNNKWYETKLGVELFNRNREIDEQLFYLLIGESCIPSIEKNKFRYIFEEQLVTQSLNATGVNIQNIVHGNVFSIEENTFFFRNIIPSQHPKGITEKFKLINNGKVKVDLQLSINKKGNSMMGFEIFPSTVSIPPHEYVYAKINFNPQIMAVYEGIFFAKVLHPAATEKDHFTFDLKGEGILPTLKIVNTKIINNILDFGKIRSDKFKLQQLVVKNIGQIAATSIFRFKNSKEFRLISPPEQTIQSQETYSYEMEFQSQKPGQFQTQIEIDTNLNPFEKVSLTLKGESYFENLSFEGIEDDTLQFNDILLNPNHQRLDKKYFEMKNYSNQIIRYTWKDLPEQFKWIKIEPKTGHIPPNLSKKIKVSLHRPSEDKQISIDLNAQVVIEDIHVIVNASFMKQRQWDSLKRSKKMVTQTEYDWMMKCKDMKNQYELEFQKNKKAKPPQYPQMPQIPDDEPFMHSVLTEIPEPEYQTIEKSQKQLQLTIQGKIDVPKITCVTKEINFKKTKMFTSRIFNLKIENNSQVSIDYFFEFFDEFSATQDPGYFSIQPKEGTISKDTFKEFLVKFSPTECDKKNQRRILFFKIKDTNITQQILLWGETERPICHFELPFMTSENQEKIVEIQSLGYTSKNIKKFYVLNPTALSYDFNWTFDHSMNSYLKCLTPKGTILSGKKFEMSFEFTPTKNCADKIEKQFLFQIPQHDIKHQFLIQAIILQPKIFFSQSKIDFGPLLLSGKGREVIVIKNLDSIPYHFNFNRQTIKGNSQSHYNSLQVEPLNGQVLPNSELPIVITFLPKNETEYNYNLICNVRSKKDPLTLNIKGIGYKLHHQVYLKKQLLSQHFIHEINFKETFVNESKQQYISLENNGDFNFDFIIQRKNNNSISISPENGTVRKNEKIQIEINFTPEEEVKLNHKIKLSIVSGPSYKFEIKGSAIYPQLQIKPSVINFGSVLVTNNPYVVQNNLRVINNDKKTLTLDTLFQKNEFLDIQLAPSQSILPYNNDKNNIFNIPVLLNLRKMGKFNEKIEFLVQNNHKIFLYVKGEGVPLSIELERPEDMNLHMGDLRPNERSIRNVNIINNSKVPIHLNFHNVEQMKNLNEFNLHINPQTLYIPQKSTGTLDVVFAPQSRLRNFTIPLHYNLKESSEQFELLMIKGACYGIDLKIMEENINFKDVVINSSLSHKFHIINLGDLNAEFKWDLGFLDEYFQIYPQMGVISSNQKLIFEAIFTPKSLNNYKATAKLLIKDLNSTIKMDLSGKGVQTSPDAIQTLSFECPVRQTITKKTTIHNDSKDIWQIFPNINFERNLIGYFHVDEQIEIEPNQSKEIEITFKPLTLHPQTQNANLFLPLKNGQAILLNLQGKPLEPNAEEQINLKLESKNNSYHTLALKNWLNINQRLNVEFKLDTGEDPITKGVIINCAKTVDINQGAHQNYKIQFNSLKEGVFKLNVYFKNYQNNEYMYYVFNINVVESNIHKEIELTQNIRESMKTIILLQNPLPKEIVIEEKDVILESNNIFISSKFPLKLAKNFDFGLELTYRPLIELDRQEQLLIIQNQDLGKFKYKLLLSSRKISNFPTIYFKCKIGDQTSKVFQFNHYLKKITPYTITLQNLVEGMQSDKQIDFIIPQQTFQAQPAIDRGGIRQSFEIKFEPSNLGIAKSLITVSNPEGGVFNAYLVGQSQHPLPKGPFKITQKGQVIEFKNPFFTAKEFTIKVENSAFTINQKNVVKLEAKKQIGINVSYKESKNCNGRMLIEFEDIQWVFYLQGEK